MKSKIIVLYGSTGDLAFRKLLPSLVELKERNIIKDNYQIIAIGRRDFDLDSYINFIQENNTSLDLSIIKDILTYFKMEITKHDDYSNLKEYLTSISNEETKVFHFLAVSPTYMKDIVNNLSLHNLISKKDKNSFVVFEKPFGNSLTESIKLNNFISRRLNENQIYRIDHYLNKDFINKLIYYRFETNIFSSFFDAKNIKKIDLILKEKDGILNRGSFFDETGIVKDMFQGHILQLITLLTMNKPWNDSYESNIREKNNTLKRIKFNKETLVFGQYNGYLEENNVEDNSQVETFFSGEFISNGININVFTGKKLDEKHTYIKLYLKDNSEITLEMYPESSLSIKSNLKYHNIDYKQVFDAKYNDYSNLFISLFNQDQENFVSRDEAEISWRITEEILNCKKELVIYKEDYLLKD